LTSAASPLSLSAAAAPPLLSAAQCQGRAQDSEDGYSKYEKSDS